MYDDDRDALAAEYVLGTLSADERDQAEALLVIDPGFAEVVRVWERRLGELNVMVEAVDPPPDVWDKIKAEIEGGAPRGFAASDGAAPELQEAAPGTAPEAGGPGFPDSEFPGSELPEQESTAQDVELQDVGLPNVGAPDITEPEMTEPEVAEPEITVPEGDAALASEHDSEPEPDAMLDFELSPEATAELLGTPATDADTPPAPQDLDALLSAQDADEPSPVAGLASSLLPPEPQAASSPPPRERSAEIIQLQRGVRRWRTVTVALGAVAAVLALYVAASQLAPELMPWKRGSANLVAGKAQPAGARLVAVLQQEPTSPAFLLTVDPQNRTFTVRTVAATPETGRNYELWLIPGKSANPRSLGLVGTEEFTTRQLPANIDLAGLRSAEYAVSLEPAGGAPGNAPTGPILFTGKMVDSLPGSPS